MLIFALLRLCVASAEERRRANVKVHGALRRHDSFRRFLASGAASAVGTLTLCVSPDSLHPHELDFQMRESELAVAPWPVLENLQHLDVEFEPEDHRTVRAPRSAATSLAQPEPDHQWTGHLLLPCWRFQPWWSVLGEAFGSLQPDCRRRHLLGSAINKLQHTAARRQQRCGWSVAHGSDAAREANRASLQHMQGQSPPSGRHLSTRQRGYHL